MTEQIWSRSLSSRELVLSLEDAIEAITVASRRGVTLLGWECWLKMTDGRTTHSMKQMGSSGEIRSLDMVIEQMKMAAKEHLDFPEVLGSRLFFCLTFGEFG